MNLTTLTCSGKRKHGGVRCYAPAVWAVKAESADTWHGSCHHHIHQVLTRLGSGGASLEVQPPARVMAELRRLRGLLRMLTDAETLVNILRPLVQNDPDPWTAQRVSERLAREGHVCDTALATEMLEQLCEEHVLEALKDGQYQAAGALPYGPDR